MIRSATAADRDAIIALQLASWRDAYAAVLPAAYLGKPMARDLASKWAKRRFETPLITLIAGDMDGFVCCESDRQPPYVDNLHVRPGLRGQGTGGLLMQALFMRLRGLGHRSCGLTVLESNDAARRFYGRLGGVEGTARSAALLGNPVTEIPLEFKL